MAPCVPLRSAIMLRHPGQPQRREAFQSPLCYGSCVVSQSRELSGTSTSGLIQAPTKSPTPRRELRQSGFSLDSSLRFVSSCQRGDPQRALSPIGSSPWDALSRLGVRHVCCSPVFPRPLPLAPPRHPRGRPKRFPVCSPASSLLWKGLTSPARSSSASTPRLPDADRSATT
jgi:hypothetical protein